jgi:hypothetical protein
MTDDDRAAVARENELAMVTNTGELSAYKDVKKKKIYVAHRGTKEKRDLSADVAIAFGAEKYHPRFKRATKRVKLIQEENPDYELVQTGHSLGGALAQHVGKRTKSDRVVTFNKGAGLGSLFRGRAKRQTDYANVFDPVSFLSLRQSGGKSRQQMKIKGKSPHDIRSSTSSFL